MTDVRVTPQPWLWKPRTKPIRFIEIHATRGNTTPALQMQAALNWVQSSRNVGNRKGDGTIDYLNPLWGSSFSCVIGTDGSQGTVLDDNQIPTYSAGYGGTGSTYAIDEYGISFELAQSANQEPFTDALYARAAKEVAAKCRQHGIPIVFIEIPSQRGEVPTGLVRHDRCENGIKLGKTDPGAQFDEARFIAEMEDDMGMTPEEAEGIYRQIDALRGALGLPAVQYPGESDALKDAPLRQRIVALEAHAENAPHHLSIEQIIDGHGPHGDGSVDEAMVRAIARDEDKKLRVTK